MARLVSVDRRDPSVEIVADELPSAPRRGWRGQRLARTGLGVGVARCAQDGDEDFGMAYLVGDRIEDRNRVADKVHKQLVARRMGLARRRRGAATPFAIEIAEPVIAVPVRMGAGDIPAVAAPASRRGGEAPHARA
jgi:hypothetical protein